MQEYDKRILISAIRQSMGIRVGDFTLASGRKSSLYVDLRRLILSRWASVPCRSVGEVLATLEFDAIGGPGLGAAPLVGALMATHWARDRRGYSPHAFVVRPEPKNHGPDGRVCGSVQPRDRCVMIEDVTTTGGSLVEAIDVVEREVVGAKVIHAIAILDRGLEVGAILEGRGIGWTPLLTIQDFGDVAALDL